MPWLKKHHSEMVAMVRRNANYRSLGKKTIYASRITLTGCPAIQLLLPFQAFLTSFLKNPIFSKRETQAQNKTIFVQMSKNDSSKPSVSRWKWSFLQDGAIYRLMQESSLELHDHGNCRNMYKDIDWSFKYFYGKLSRRSCVCSYLILHLMLHYLWIIMI